VQGQCTAYPVRGMGRWLSTRTLANECPQLANWPSKVTGVASMVHNQLPKAVLGPTESRPDHTHPRTLLIERRPAFDVPGVGLGQPANALRVYDPSYTGTAHGLFLATGFFSRAREDCTKGARERTNHVLRKPDNLISYRQVTEIAGPRHGRVSSGAD
jgi:hypothetical protein